MADAVLLAADLDAGRFPDRCVITGETTETATHVWAVESKRADLIVGLVGVAGVRALQLLGREVRRVPLPVVQPRWRAWRWRAGACAALTWFGIGALVMSLRNADAYLAVIAAVIVVASLLMRVRAMRAFWVTLELRPAPGHVVVRRAHPAFDGVARALFLRR